ncbi:uncharacterized protein [Salminus brasiliensis]|uniref:uncharacterized protein isoform X2 n=1 Tax=Salminus brasiliensis TaxID=930266 RepID=UPI003B832710
MAAETTHHTTRAVQLHECLTGSLADATSTAPNTENIHLSGELKNSEAHEDEQVKPEDKSETYISTADSTVRSPEAPGLSRRELIAIPSELNKEEKHKQVALEESKGVPILQEDPNEEDQDAVSYPEEHKTQPTDTSAQLEGASPTKEGDNNIPIEEHGGEIVTIEDDNARQEEKVNESSQKEETIIAQRVEESSAALAKEDFNITHQETNFSAASESDVDVNPKGKEDHVSHSGDGTVSIIKDSAVCLAADEVHEVDTKELKDPCDPHQKHHLSKTQPVEPKTIFKYSRSSNTADIGFPVLQSKADISSFHPKGALAENIHQGELLLYRLHLVQQNQELQQVSDGPSASNTVAIVMANDTVKSVTMMPGTEGENDEQKEGDLPCRVETTQKKENQTEAVDTSSAGIEEHRQAKMEKENTRPLEETPIQREIRQGLERENSLRRSRGLDNWADKSLELVEIPVKRSLEVPDSSSCTDLAFNADKRLAKRKMLQDINQEAMKEQAVKKLGKVPGIYDKGYAREIKERKMLFEAFHQCRKVDAQGSSRGRKLFSSSFTAKNAETLGEQGESLPFACKFGRTRSLEIFTNDLFKDSSAPLPGCESGQNDTDSHKECQMKDLEGDATSHDDASLHETQSKSLRQALSLSSLDLDSGIMPSVQDNYKEDEASSVLKGRNPFFQLRPSMSLRPDVEKEIQEAMEREQELRRLRSHLYGDQGDRQEVQLEGNTQSSCPESTSTLSDHVHRGKLTLIWPPPCSKVIEEPGPQKPIGQRPTLWHYWETGMVTSSCSEKD